ncbi:MAG: primosomal protein N' [Geobacter sp.]|nr:primosomal protein N' [Geobacter sp.]
MPETSPLIVDVVVPLPLEATYSYRVPDGITGILPGMRVLVPFGRRTLTAYVIGFTTHPPAELKEIIALLDSYPLFTAGELEFFRWAADYYLHPLGEVIRAALPAGINLTGKKQQSITIDGTTVTEEVLVGGRSICRERFYRPDDRQGDTARLRGRKLAVMEFLRSAGEAPATLLRRETGIDAAGLRQLVQAGFITCEEREVYRDPFREEVQTRDEPLALTDAQGEAVRLLTAALDRRLFAPFLLHGVTGSGKTEVYLQSIAYCLAQGRRALVLVPEIGLTPQLVRRFRCRFGDGIAVLHSGLSAGERFDEWRRIRRGEVEIVIGARSAIFAPLERIGMIIVDEEHEGSYKQGEGFRYNARDLALIRGRKDGACVVLGSATPQIATYHAAKSGKLGYLPLPGRVRDLPLPETVLVDCRGTRKDPLTPLLKEAMAANLAKGGQTLLFLNRRGYATYLVCEACGHVFRCPNCAVTLTHHRRKSRHYCHYCDYSIPAPSVCPGCGGGEIVHLGLGTERLEEEIRQLFPEARVIRMDRDTTSGKGGHDRIIRQVEAGSIDILIGTQMVAKGHDFPGVTLVGVVSADAALNLPDFRSAERTFQLITQVIGRAGRGDQPGRVLVQTLAPEHYALTHALAHDYPGFYDAELAFRSELDYPPFAFLAAIELSATAARTVEETAHRVADELSRLKRAKAVRVTILGPAPAPLTMLRGRHRWQILLKSRQRSDLHRLLRSFREACVVPATVRLSIDIDPVDML